MKSSSSVAKSSSSSRRYRMCSGATSKTDSAFTHPGAPPRSSSPDIGRDAPFSAEHKGLLEEFLRDCDLVKFAEHYPCARGNHKGVDSCKAFIDATKLGDETRNTRGRRGRGELAMRFEFPWAFLILPLVVLLVWFSLRRRQGAGLKFSSVQHRRFIGAVFKDPPAPSAPDCSCRRRCSAHHRPCASPAGQGRSAGCEQGNCHRNGR